MPTHTSALRKSPSGPSAGRVGTMALATTAVATTAAGTATGSFTGARTGDCVTICPQANLIASLAIAYSRVYAAGLIVVGFTNVGASTATGAITVDVALRSKAH